MLKEIYLVDFNKDIIDLQNWISIYSITKEYAQKTKYYFRLDFKKDILISIKEFQENKLYKEYDYEQIGNFMLKDIISQNYYGIKFDPTGKSFFGGSCPQKFILPKFEIGPIQYMGKLLREDEAFSWLPFDLHLCWPALLEFDLIEMDYSNELCPKILKIDAWAEYPELMRSLNVEYSKKYIKLNVVSKYDIFESRNFQLNYIGHTTIPNTPQWSIPDYSTVSKSKTKLICQIHEINIESELVYKDEFKDLGRIYQDIYTLGDVYISIDIKNKIIQYIRQIT